MTLQGISSKIIKWFKANDTFTMDDVVNVTDVNILPKNLLLKVVEEALKAFEEQKIITKIVDNTNGKLDSVWILNRPLEDYEQTVTLHGQTILAITNVINSLCDEKVDPLNITEQDIQSIIVVAAKNLDEDSQNE